jgi:NB-ARC domain
MKQIEPASSVDRPDVPLLIAPLGFRPNSVFYGFDTELEQLEVKLHNKKRQAIGSCSVLVTGTAGCGKTHLVRQYVWQSRAKGKYPEGIFWVDAKSKENVYRSFWDIGQAAALLGANKPRNQDWDAASKYVDTVRMWLEKKTGWLLVFDGLSFDNEDEISDFLTFVPDSKGNCILITSVDKTLRGRQRLLNPTSVKVQPLSPQDGCSLLFESLNIRHPSEAQTVKARDLVKHYEGLPLAIHAAAHALFAKGRALETYTPGVTEKRLAEPYLEIMQALRENSHVEAVNFITLLSYFNHNVPVALINLGRRALTDFNIDIRSTDRENSNKNELDNTIAVLIKYGLITRVLQPYHLVERSPSKEASLNTTADSFSAQTDNGNGTPVESRSRRDSEMTTRGLQENIKPGFELITGNGHLEEPVYASIDTQTNPIALRFAAEPRPESSVDSSSGKSIKYNIDILRVHTVVQNVFRDELRLKDRERYFWWLIAAVRVFSLSYAVADTRIKASPQQGLVRDYREFETQAAALRSHFPRPEKAPADLRKVRSELRGVLRKIRHEIRIRSPSHSIESLRHRVQISIFERSSSTSSDAPDTPTDGSQTDSWSLNEPLIESPTGIERPPLPDPAESSDSWDDRGHETDYESSAVTTRRSSRSEIDTDMPTGPDPEAGRRASFLQAIFKGRPVLTKKQKDLGEWKPLPAAPSLTPSDVKATPSRTSSASHSLDERKARTISAGSEAEAALAAVHRMSPPASRGGRIRSPSRSLLFDAGDNTRRPLEDRNPNTQLSPLAAEFKSSTQSSSRHHSRTSSSSPRMAQLAMANAATSSNNNLPPVNESATVARRTPASVQQRTFYGSPPSIAVNQQVQYLPTGYSSTPMSRDNSKESTRSLLSAPATTGLGLQGTSLPTRDARPTQSIDVVAANEMEFGRIGEWSNNVTPFTPTMPTLNIPGSIDAVQFGQMVPVMLEEARRRADEYARRGNQQKENR